MSPVIIAFLPKRALVCAPPMNERKISEEGYRLFMRNAMILTAGLDDERNGLWPATID
jgi:hypothetical protein